MDDRDKSSASFREEFMNALDGNASKSRVPPWLASLLLVLSLFFLAGAAAGMITSLVGSVPTIAGAHPPPFNPYTASTIDTLANVLPGTSWFVLSPLGFILALLVLRSPSHRRNRLGLAALIGHSALLACIPAFLFIGTLIAGP